MPLLSVVSSAASQTTANTPKPWKNNSCEMNNLIQFDFNHLSIHCFFVFKHLCADSFTCTCGINCLRAPLWWPICGTLLANAFFRIFWCKFVPLTWCVAEWIFGSCTYLLTKTNYIRRHSSRQRRQMPLFACSPFQYDAGERITEFANERCTRM